jgi:hypothetical protein
MGWLRKKMNMHSRVALLLSVAFFVYGASTLSAALGSEPFPYRHR